MKNVLSRKVLSTVVAGSLLFSAGGAIVSAAPKEEKKDTGRTEQKVQTGVIKFNKVDDVPRHAKEVILSGTVVLDGPQLVFSISGVKSEDIKITKTGDKTWMYEAVVDVSEKKDDIYFEVSAKTIYANGKTAGTVHTSAPTVTQKIHVPFIVNTFAENPKWAYDRPNNQFTLTYDKVEYWSEGNPDTTAAISVPVNGVEDIVEVHDTTLFVPFAYQDITFSPVNWEFHEPTKTYSGIVDITITDRKGIITTDSVKLTGLKPAMMHTFPYSLTDDIGIFTKTADYMAPEAPEAPVPVKVEILKLTLKPNGGQKVPNNFKVIATYEIHNSDGSIEVVREDDLGEAIGNPHPESGGKKYSPQDYVIATFVYTVTVTYNPGTGEYKADAVLKK
ncbi:hypothetical protein [Sporosarcina sp. Marseille-Q4943]|uniref:hypothetical protein n=1 Tax=Sporosarcina sp. Marseille-Q4943 TaxID=2942204 RepID=UPI00208DD6F7|nr:hypothetical protein [Sporosarcina sp. Marseille-Q4943]